MAWEEGRASVFADRGGEEEARRCLPVSLARCVPDAWSRFIDDAGACAVLLEVGVRRKEEDGEEGVVMSKMERRRSSSCVTAKYHKQLL